MNAPITARIACFVRQASGTIRRLDCNLVQTSLGEMVEYSTVYRNGGNVTNDDVHDSDFSDIRVFNDADLAVFAGGTPLTDCQWPRTF